MHKIQVCAHIRQNFWICLWLSRTFLPTITCVLLLRIATKPLNNPLQMLKMPFILFSFTGFQNTTVINDNETTLSLMNRNESCIEGWIQHGNSCYIFSSNLANWQGARQRCQLYGADLVVVNDATENTFLFGMYSPITTNHPSCQHVWNDILLMVKVTCKYTENM